MPFYETGDVRIHDEEVGSGFPVLLIPGGGLHSTIAWNAEGAPFTPVEEFSTAYRCMTADVRTASSGQSSGPLEIDRPWDAYTDDHLGLMDPLGIKRCRVLGFCLGGPYIWNLWQRAPERIVAAVAAPPSGWRKELPHLSYETNMTGWGPEITMAMVHDFLTTMDTKRADFVYTVSRDFVRSCQAPVLVMPDDSPPHPYPIAMESARLAPQSAVSLFPWKDPQDRIPVAVRQGRSFLRAQQPAMA